MADHQAAFTDIKTEREEDISICQDPLNTSELHPDLRSDLQTSFETDPNAPGSSHESSFLSYNQEPFYR